MQTVGILCEYNPFHFGHLYHLQEIRRMLGEDTAIICLMAGNYVQRGEPAVFSKDIRAKAAVDCGADLVLEYPVTCCLRSAEGYASGAVDIFNALGPITGLSFGCECGDLQRLNAITDALLSDSFPPLLRKWLDEGLSFAVARQKAVDSLTGLGALIAAPNNILAVEYCKALRQSSSAMLPLPVLRSDMVSSPRVSALSASAIRACMRNGSDWTAWVPKSALPAFRGAVPHFPEYGERAVLARLRSMTDKQWETVPFGTEGLGNKLRKAVRAESSVDGILTASLSKRYPQARLRRMILCAYLGIDGSLLDSPPPYIRVLALNSTGGKLLRAIRAADGIPVINAGQTSPNSIYAELERRAADLYELFSAGIPVAGREQALRNYYPVPPGPMT